MTVGLVKLLEFLVARLPHLFVRGRIEIVIVIEIVMVREAAVAAR